MIMERGQVGGHQAFVEPLWLHACKREFWFALLLCVGWIEVAIAEDLPFPPAQYKVCTAEHVVDKEKLATYLLRKYPVSALAISAVPADKQPVNSNRKLLEGLLGTKDVCKDKCGPSDQEYLIHISGNMNQLMAGSSSKAFHPSKYASPAKYFGPEEGNEIQCMRTAGTDQPIEAPGAIFSPPPKEDSNFRIRGSANQLTIDRSKPDFAGSDKATIDVARNYVAGSKTSKVVGFIGYSIQTDAREGLNGNRLDIIPYFGINRNVVTVSAGSSVKPSASNTTESGILVSKYIVGEGDSFGHLINLRPDYLLDHQTGVRLFTVNLEYVPVRNNLINSYIPLMGGSFAVEPVFSIKNDNGHFADRGNPTVASKNKDFVRLGPQFGLAALSGNPLLPLDASTIYTKLRALSGTTNVSYSKTSLNYSLDPKKYFGIGLSYSHGTREDTAKSERLGEVGLTIKF